MDTKDSLNENIVLTSNELDAIGEVMNISMGAAATAVSTMLDKQVTITTPALEQSIKGDVDCSKFDPAIIVKVKYVEGIEGDNIIIIRSHDMQVILNLLMGNEDAEIIDDFEFDEMSMSAACEVMNQMMGASATALAEILGFSINISTPDAIQANTKEAINSAFKDINEGQEIVTISFVLMIKDVINTDFRCLMPAPLVRKMISHVMQDMADQSEVKADTTNDLPQNQAASMMDTPAFVPQPLPVMEEPMPSMMQNVPAQAMPQTSPIQPAMQDPAAQPMNPAFQQQGFVSAQQPMTQPSPAYAQQPIPPYAPPYSPGYPQQPMQIPYPPQPMYPQGYAQQPYPAADQRPALNIKKAEFPNFSDQNAHSQAPGISNMDLLMSVPLEVSVVIGKAKKKIKDIMEFGQGTVVELDKQTGAPAEIIVNGKLLAYGDIIVVGDNFGVRVTEIVGTKELLSSLEQQI